MFGLQFRFGLQVVPMFGFKFRFGLKRSYRFAWSYRFLAFVTFYFRCVRDAIKPLTVVRIAAPEYEVANKNSIPSTEIEYLRSDAKLYT